MISNISNISNIYFDFLEEDLLPRRLPRNLVVAEQTLLHQQTNKTTKIETPIALTIQNRSENRINPPLPHLPMKSNLLTQQQQMGENEIKCDKMD